MNQCILELNINSCYHQKPGKTKKANELVSADKRTTTTESLTKTTNV